MKPSRDTTRAQALLRLERTRTRLLLRCANDQSEAATETRLQPDGLGFGSTLNTALAEWLANELAARLWPDEPLHADQAAGTDDGHPHPPPLAQSLIQPLAQPFVDWAVRHPWLSMAAGVLAGSLAMSQRQRLLRWVISAGLPWLTSQAAVVAAPLLAQWLVRQAPPQAPAADATTPATDPADTANTAPTMASCDTTTDLSSANSPAAGSPG